MAKKKIVKKTTKKKVVARKSAAAKKPVPARKPVSKKNSAAKKSAPPRRSYGRQGPKPQGPLVGYRVIDLGMIFAGPLVCTLLADLGADVIKVEHPDGDDVRLTGKFKD